MFYKQLTAFFGGGELTPTMFLTFINLADNVIYRLNSRTIISDSQQTQKMNESEIVYSIFLCSFWRSTLKSREVRIKGLARGNIYIYINSKNKKI